MMLVEHLNIKMEREGTGDTDWNDFEKSLEVRLRCRGPIAAS